MFDERSPLKRGRKHMKEGDKRNHYVQVGLTSWEKDQLTKMAHFKGTSPPSILRDLLLRVFHKKGIKKED